jgi:hypothetical protein
VAGTEGVGDVAVILAALIGIANQQRNRRTGGLALVDAGKDLDLVRLVTLRGMPTAAGGAAIEIGAKLLGIEPVRAGSRRSRNRWPAMAFAEGGDGEELAG